MGADTLLAFLEGLALVASPCILPVLPVILGASMDGDRARPLGIVAGFVLAFSVFAIAARTLLSTSALDSEMVRNLSLFFLGALGLVLLVPPLSLVWDRALAGLSARAGGAAARIQAPGFAGGLGIGALLGIVWTPCAGPILGAAVLGIIQAQSTAAAAINIAAFATGAGVPMLAIALLGRRMLDRLGFLRRHASAVRRIAGALMLVAAVAIYTGLDLKLVEWQARSDAGARGAPAMLRNLLDKPYPAPEIQGISAWLNGDPVTLESLRGKVVLIDFWTYSCINCIRTLPHVTRWYDTYGEDGFVVVGVHTPEFPFEKKVENVRAAIADYGIRYRVAMDNDYATWQAFKNRYWPAHYLIDRQGRVVYTHFGEGDYDVTEGNIRALLGQSGAAPKTPPPPIRRGQTPETYLGYARAKNYAGTPALARDTAAAYAFPAQLALHEWALSGPWAVRAQMAAGGKDAALRLRYHAARVHLVMGTADGRPVDVDIFADGKLLRTVSVTRHQLYTLLENAAPVPGTIEIRPRRAGLEIYAFTFGS